MPFLHQTILAKHQADQRARATATYDPAAWVERRVDAGRPGSASAPYQRECLAALSTHRRAALRGPHSLGKTATAAWAILSFVEAFDGLFDWKVVTTASAWRQLTRYLWPEVHKWAGRLRLDVPDLLKQSIHGKTGEAFPAASNRPELIEGAQAERLLYLVDEAKAVPEGTWDAIEGALAGTGEVYQLAISTPGPPAGRFYKIHQRAAGYQEWWAKHVTLAEAVAAGRVDAAWAEKRKAQWGEASAVYRQRVLGEFAADDEDAVIRLSNVEAANERWYEWDDAGRPGAFTCAGCDIARGGMAKTVIARRFQRTLAELERHDYRDTMAAAGIIVGVLRAHGGFASIDVNQLGAGVVDRVREQGFKVLAFNGSAKTDRRDKSGELGFVNTRSAAWWNVRELLEPDQADPIALPEDDDLTGDLTSVNQQPPRSEGKISIETKDDVVARLGKSPDAGDACVMAFWRDALTSGKIAVGQPRTWAKQSADL